MALDPAEPMLKSLDLSLRVLEALDNGMPERGVSALAREVGASKAAVYRILSTLQRREYVVQNPSTSQYAIGPALRRFGRVAASRLNLPAAARPFMVELRDLTEDAVHLAILDGAEAVYVAKEEGLHPVQVMSRVGARCPAHCVATGKALLAYADDAVHDRLVVAGLTRYTPLTHAEPDDFRQEMARIREHGYAVNEGEWRTEVRGVAVPVFDGSGRAVAAIGVCSPAVRMPDERVFATIPIVLDVASRLSAHLGAPTPAVRLGGDAPPTPDPIDRFGGTRERHDWR